MAEYIEREATKRAFQNMDAGRRVGSTLLSPEEFAEYLDEFPAADVAPVVHGRWVSNGIPDSILSGCSACGFSCGASSFRYCPNCGARMNGGDGNEAS